MSWAAARLYPVLVAGLCTVALATPPPASTVVASVEVFVRRDCPISNRYAPELRRLHDKFASRGVAFRLVFPAPDETEASIRRHLEEYELPLEAVRDPEQELVRAAGVRVTPEAAVHVGGALVYRGRIDDLYPSLGHRRNAATSHDLESALEAILAGRPVPVPRTSAVGCTISPPQ